MGMFECNSELQMTMCAGCKCMQPLGRMMHFVRMSKCLRSNGESVYTVARAAPKQFVVSGSLA